MSIQVDPSSMISEACPNGTHGHHAVQQPNIMKDKR